MTSQNELTDSTLIITVVSKPTALVFSSYMTLLILKYGSRMEFTQEAHLRVEQEGISFREAQCIVESDLFLDEYPLVGFGDPTSARNSPRNVPACRGQRTEGGRMHVPPRPPGQCERA